MIDIEPSVFAALADKLHAKFPDLAVSGEEIYAPSVFPYASIVEADNATAERHRDTSDREKYASLMYEVNVYSNKAVGKKRECRDILGEIDDWMYRHNFRRLSMHPVPNLENATIYRLTARYRVISDGNSFYR